MPHLPDLSLRIASRTASRTARPRAATPVPTLAARPARLDGRVAVLVLVIAMLLSLGVAASAQDVVVRPTVRESAVEHAVASAAVADTRSRKVVPFAAGERLEFDVKFGPLRVGSGQMEVVGTDTIRGREAWRTRFTLRGGTIGFRVHDRLESWMDTRTLHSLRFVQDLEEGGRDRERHYEIFPESETFLEKSDGRMQRSVDEPLDDGAFLYFIRTLPLEVGKTYEFDRYFRPDRNPVKVQVLRRETIKVPAGTFQTIVLRPVIKAKGIFSENGRAEIWLTDDDRRMMVQMKTHLKFGTISLSLKRATEGEGEP
jgi:hypothetical protein